MKKLSLFLFLSLTVLFSNSQKVSGKLKFDQGQALNITLQTKTTIAQQAMGQAIDFNIDATGIHEYKVTNYTDDNSTLNHQVKGVSFAFDGMGQKRTFDSNNEKDLNGPFGKPIKDLLDKKFDMIIDPSGNTLMAVPEKIELTQNDSRMALVSNMMKDVFELVQPPKKGRASFFKVLPESEVGKGDTWTESYDIDGGKYNATYTLADVTDSLIIIDFTATSSTITKAEMMGNETTTTMNNKSTGKILVDKATGIMREKTITTESNGSTEAAFGTLPVTSRTSTIISVK
ncbi:MAG TPA: DUF6263 family protein [Chitinophagaceae bacterium]|nr:DUF6263 family protein [Chitinophagaceae bacterium]